MLRLIILITTILSLLACATPPDEDPYTVLGVSRSATGREIRRAYKALAIQHHPDKAHGGGEAKSRAEEAFRRIQNAYEILSDTGSRQRYDTTGDPEGVQGRGGYGGYRYQQHPGAQGAVEKAGGHSVTLSSFEHVVERGDPDALVVILFYSLRTKPSRDAMATFARVADVLHGMAEFVRIDTDAEWRLVRQFRLYSVPTVMFYIRASGRYVRYSGALSPGPLRKSILGKIPLLASSAGQNNPILVSLDAVKRALAKHASPVFVACSSKKKPSSLLRFVAAQYAALASFAHAKKGSPLAEFAGCNGEDGAGFPGFLVRRSLDEADTVIYDEPNIDGSSLQAWIETQAFALLPTLRAENMGLVCGESARSPISACLIVDASGLVDSVSRWNVLASVQRALAKEDWARGVRIALLDFASESSFVSASRSSSSWPTSVPPGSVRAIYLNVDDTASTSFILDLETDGETGVWEALKALTSSPATKKWQSLRGARHKRLDIVPRPQNGVYGSSGGSGIVWQVIVGISRMVSWAGHIIQTIVTLGFSLAIVVVLFLGFLR